MSEDLHVGLEALKTLHGDRKLEALKLLEAEGVIFVPKHQEILERSLIEKKSFSKRYALHLNDGVKLYMWGNTKNPIVKVSMKDKRVMLRHTPKLVHFVGSEALILLDKRRPRLAMRWLRLFAAILPLRMAFNTDPAPHSLVCRVPARVARLFLMPASHNG